MASPYLDISTPTKVAVACLRIAAELASFSIWRLQLWNARRGHMHPEQRQFCESVRNRFVTEFANPTARVLDCGSLDINGSNRYLFASMDYTGVDLGPGLNVDVVCPTHEFDGESDSFDIVISTECFEHDKHYAKSLANMLRVLKPGGLMVFTCATTGRPEHGTSQAHPDSAPFTNDYYRNLTIEDIKAVMPMDAFEEYEFSVNERSHDLYFWGRKRIW